MDDELRLDEVSLKIYLKSGSCKLESPAASHKKRHDPHSAAGVCYGFATPAAVSPSGLNIIQLTGCKLPFNQAGTM